MSVSPPPLPIESFAIIYDRRQYTWDRPRDMADRRIVAVNEVQICYFILTCYVLSSFIRYLLIHLLLSLHISLLMY